MKETKTYTAADIERYHLGQMMPAERHALEAAALEDPFLADAVEGYVFSKQPQIETGQLQQQLAERIASRQNKKPLFSLHPWMKVAALFILIAGAGWLVILTFKQKNENVALTETNTPAVNETIVQDSTMTTTDQPENQAANELLVLPTEEIVARNESTQRESEEPQQTKPTAPTESVTQATRTTQAPRTTLDKGIAESNSTSALTDDIENTDVAKLKDTLRVDVVMQSDDANLQEVVVTGYNKNRKATAKKQAAVLPDSLQPVNGWAAFDDYIEKNRRTGLLQVDKDAGVVDLEFEITNQGVPKNIEVVKSLCGACDAEATRLLKEGPKWRGKNKKGKVSIRFE